MQQQYRINELCLCCCVSFCYSIDNTVNDDNVPFFESALEEEIRLKLLAEACEEVIENDACNGVILGDSFISCNESPECSFKSCVDNDNQKKCVNGSICEVNDDAMLVTNPVECSLVGEVTNKMLINNHTIPHNLKIVLQNVQGIRQGGESEVVELIKNSTPTICVITEHWKKLESTLPEINGYTKRVKCRKRKKGGGVVIWISNELGSSYSMNMEYGDSSIDDDIMWTVIPKYGIVICSVYMSPTEDMHWSSMLIHLDRCIGECKERGLKILIAGDLNCKLLEKSGGDREEMMWTLMKKYNLVLSNKDNSKYTRVPDVNKHGLMQTYVPAELDYVLVDDKLKVTSYHADMIREISMISDHVAVEVQIELNEDEEWKELAHKEEKEGIKWSNKKLRDMECRLIYEKRIEDACESLIVTGQVPEDYKAFHRIFQEVGGEVFARKKGGKEEKEDKHLQFLLRKLRRARKNWRYANRKGICILKDRYALNIARTKMEIKEHKDKKKEYMLNNYIKSFYRERGPGILKLCQYVAESKWSPSEQFLLKNEQGEYIKEKAPVLEKLKKFVDSIFLIQVWPEHYLTPIPNSLKLNDAAQELLGSEIKLEELAEACRGLNLGTSTGTTDIPPECLRYVGEKMRVMLLEFFNNMKNSNSITDENYTSNITFLHKKGRTDNIENYRTLATGCNIYKLFLKILANRIQKVTEAQGLLGNIQCGFRSGRRGAENLFILDTIIMHSKKNNLKTMIAMLDLKKAYDRVCRESLWYKMRMYGFPEGFMQLLELVYKESYGVLKFQNIKSEPVEIKLGLKQGCVLSPVLFSLYLADLGRVLENAGVGLKLGNVNIPALFFADDMLVIQEEKNFQNLLHVVGEYASIWKLEFLVKKVWCYQCIGR